MPAFTTNIQEKTLENPYFRQVLFTGQHCQLVVMCLQPSEEIGLETHPNVDQFFRIEAGECVAVVDGVEYQLKADDVLIVPAGSAHNLTNSSNQLPLKLYTIYSPANHPAGTIHATKADAQKAEAAEHL